MLKQSTAALEKAKTALKEHENNAEELQKATDELPASHKVAEQLYKNKQAEGGTSDEASAKSDDDKKSGGDQGPIDAEVS